MPRHEYLTDEVREPARACWKEKRHKRLILSPIHAKNKNDDQTKINNKLMKNLHPYSKAVNSKGTHRYPSKEKKKQTSDTVNSTTKKKHGGRKKRRI
jgi:hypothetical protein